MCPQRDRAAGEPGWEMERWRRRVGRRRGGGGGEVKHSPETAARQGLLVLCAWATAGRGCSSPARPQGGSSVQRSSITRTHPPRTSGGSQSCATQGSQGCRHISDKTTGLDRSRGSGSSASSKTSSYTSGMQGTYLKDGGND
ncbi:unnamed protein product [Pleuronectes platessa]|uniref:Uncharacterized protein n=1 Tax=Pleuronectes platessa TaxID=8262 RepID=A0A9N7Y424_PLEPL|nr:unnamed protein product [Pleuronectes platessa]